MKPIENWNNIEEPTKFEQIALGGHYCKIVNAKVDTTAKGGEMLVIAFDFAPADNQAGYFKKQFDSDTEYNKSTAKWRGVYYQMFGNEVSNKYFKQFINYIEESNTSYSWNWDEKSLIGLLFGGVFGREEYINNKGERKFSTKCRFITTYHEVKDVEAPKDVLLDNVQTSSQNTTPNYSTDTLNIQPDDLPF